MRDILESCVAKTEGFVELRYHQRTARSFMAQKGRVDTSHQTVASGIGVRALVDGAWGFAATSHLDMASILRAIAKAQDHGRLMARSRGNMSPTTLPATDRLARGDFVGDGVKALTQVPHADLIGQVVSFERELAGRSAAIQSAKCRYAEIHEVKAIVTSDGASASLEVVQPELSVSAIAERDGDRAVGHLSAGVSGDWQCLVRHPALDHMVERTANMAVDLIRAPYADGGLHTVILSPSVVGLLCHEAVGHTVEADFVRSGSVARDRLGTRVASDLVSMADSGNAPDHPTGNIPFDDEGILTGTTLIIDRGFLKSFLHNRESAAEFGVAPTGNARAWMYEDEPLIRMRNTYLLPGQDSLSDMLAQTEDGYFVEGSSGGQADSNGEFMFGASYLWRIRKGKKAELLRETTLSGIAFDVLQTVDAVSRDFRWDLGAGHCGKGQPAKVDAGGPYIRCKMTVGGR